MLCTHNPASKHKETLAHVTQMNPGDTRLSAMLVKQVREGRVRLRVEGGEERRGEGQRERVGIVMEIEIARRMLAARGWKDRVGSCLVSGFGSA